MNYIFRHIEGEEVAVKVQRPFVLETVSLDLYLVRKFGLFLRNFPQVNHIRYCMIIYMSIIHKAVQSLRYSGFT